MSQGGDPIAIALELGKDVLFPTPSQIFLDIDSADRYEHVLASLAEYRLLYNMSLTIVYDCPSKTEGHRHMILDEGRDLNEFERIAWQILLGSDRIREILNLLDIVKGNPGNCLFIPKGFTL